MKLLCLFLSLFAVAACGRADAAETSRPTLTVDYLQNDSVRVIARWSRPCDDKGCADSYRVQWQLSTLPKTTTRTVDTAYFKKPAIGDTALVEVFVTSVRRGIDGTFRTARTVLRNPDAPPPPVDSLRTDTLSLAERAELDSFPVIAVRDTLGRSSGTYAPGEGTVLCGLARNRYTGDVRLYIPADAPPEADAYLERVCERARMAFVFERAG